MTKYRRVSVGAALVLLLTSLGSTGPAFASAQRSATAASLNPYILAAASERLRYGLDADPGRVATIIAAGLDVGSSSVGVVLTKAEAVKLDLPGRSLKADHAEKKILPVAKRQRGFAGMFQDQLHGGRIVVRYTTLSARGRTQVEAAAGMTDLVIETGAASTLSSLQAAADTVMARRTVLFPGVEVNGAGIDEVNNRLDVGVASRDFDKASQLSAGVAAELNVEVHLITAEKAQDQAQVCDSSGRSYCYNPMRAGTLVRSATVNGGICTMGFHVKSKANTALKFFMLSGHCSFPSASRNWYMQGGYAGTAGNGWIGNASSTNNRFKDLGEDAMAVSFNETNQVSRQIYDTSRAVAGSGNPVQGETIWISPGKTDEDTGSGTDSGTVAHATWSYVDTDTGYIIHAADADGFSTRSGDSGSPIYRAPGSGGAIALGVHDTAQGYFARMQDVLNALNMSIY